MAKETVKKKKIGRPKAIETPEQMWQLFQEYAAHTKKNPIKVKDWVGGMGKQIIREKERPLTLEGFELYVFEMGVGCHTLDHYFSNREGRYENFVAVCLLIRKQIRQDQIAGGMAGIYNPSITQRLNGLVEKTENKHEVTEIKITHDR